MFAATSPLLPAMGFFILSDYLLVSICYRRMANGIAAPVPLAPKRLKCEECTVRCGARKGGNAGSEFLGRLRFPDCRGVRPV